MCVNYDSVSRGQLDLFELASLQGDLDWRQEVYQDYAAPFIRGGKDGSRDGIVGSYGMVPKSHIPPGVKKFTTMNARAETVGQLRSFSKPWRMGQLCLVPMTGFYEPNWETGGAVRWRISMADRKPFAVAGLYKSWQKEDGSETFSFTQLTINADAHPVMRRFHKPGDEKRSLVIIQLDDYDEWLQCKDVERARSFLTLCPPELLAIEPAPRPKFSKTTKTEIADSESADLF